MPMKAEVDALLGQIDGCLTSIAHSGDHGLAGVADIIAASKDVLRALAEDNDSLRAECVGLCLDWHDMLKRAESAESRAIASEEAFTALETELEMWKQSEATASRQHDKREGEVDKALAHIRAQDAEINMKADFIEATVNQLAIAEDRIKRLETALRGIAIEAERENGAWVHLKRVIGLNVRAALEETHDRG